MALDRSSPTLGPSRSALALRRAGLPVVAALLASAAVVPFAPAEDVSAPAILQWFDGSYRSMERRSADVFNAGYGAIWAPPPGRADTGDHSVGYDVYDRFDLGTGGRPTLFGTATGLKQSVNVLHRAGVDFHVDFVINHNGYSTLGTHENGRTFASAGGYPGLAITLPNDIDGDFHGAFEGGDHNGRLAGLIDIAHEKNHQLIRHPVDPNDSRNIPAGTQTVYGRIANVPTQSNRQFYPDRDGPSIDVFDPATGEGGVRIYSFSNADPMAGDAVPENATGLLMRNAQWLVQTVGVDGFRLDAAKHVPGYVLTYFDRAVYRSHPQKLLDGSTKHVFSYGEVFDSNREVLLYGPDGQFGDPNAPVGSAAHNAWKDNYVRKDINNADPGRVGGNRDVLDFAIADALEHNLSGNGFQNDWRNVANAGLDARDDGLHNGSAGVMFVGSHDEGKGAQLNNVAHAYTLMHPGNAVVYFNAKEHGSRDFPKDGRGDALGGMYGSAITTLTNIRNTHGRGNYRERWLEKENLAYEREGSAVVLMSNRLDGGYDTRRMDVGFAWGTTLVELTGNAAADGNIAELVTVDNDFFEGPSKATFRFRRNNGGDGGYLIYGLATPRSQDGIELSGVSQTIAGENPNAGPESEDYRNATKRLADLKIITGDSFGLSLSTQAVTLSGTRLEKDAFGNDVLVQRSIRDRDADGDNALFKLDGGLDANGNGQVDFVAPGSVVYGFEQFTGTRQSGYEQGSGNGLYSQSINAAGLSEGYHFIEVRAFRHRADNGPAVYSSFKQTIYVDRLKPLSQPDGEKVISADSRDFFFRSLDMTADNMHVFLDLPAGLSDGQVLGMVGGGSQTDAWDRDVFKKYFDNLSDGNHAFTVVTFEITGNWNVQRFGGFYTDTSIGAGFGDVRGLNTGSGPDGWIEGNDLLAIHDVIAPGTQAGFFAPADLNGDGLMSVGDWTLLGQWLEGLHDAGLTNPGGGPLVSQGTLNYYYQLSATVPEPAAGLVVFLAGALLCRRGARARRRCGGAGAAQDI